MIRVKIVLSFLFINILNSQEFKDVTIKNIHFESYNDLNGEKFYIDKGNKSILKDVKVRLLPGNGFPPSEYLRTFKIVGYSKNGIETSYYKNGSVQSTSNYLNNALNGEQISYYENGTIESKTYYDKGRKSGSSFFYYPTGELLSTTSHKNQKNEGVKYFNKEGINFFTQSTTESGPYYKVYNGKTGVLLYSEVGNKICLFDQDGIGLSEQNFKFEVKLPNPRFKQYGPITRGMFNRNMEGGFVDGQPNGPLLIKNYKGDKIKEMHYVNGVLDGLQIVDFGVKNSRKEEFYNMGTFLGSKKYNLEGELDNEYVENLDNPGKGNFYTYKNGKQVSKRGYLNENTSIYLDSVNCPINGTYPIFGYHAEFKNGLLYKTKHYRKDNSLEKISTFNGNLRIDSTFYQKVGQTKDVDLIYTIEKRTKVTEQGYRTTNIRYYDMNSKFIHENKFKEDKPIGVQKSFSDWTINNTRIYLHESKRITYDLSGEKDGEFSINNRVSALNNSPRLNCTGNYIDDKLDGIVRYYSTSREIIEFERENHYMTDFYKKGKLLERILHIKHIPQGPNVRNHNNPAPVTTPVPGEKFKITHRFSSSKCTYSVYLNDTSDGTVNCKNYRYFGSVSKGRYLDVSVEEGRSSEIKVMKIGCTNLCEAAGGIKYYTNVVPKGLKKNVLIPVKSFHEFDDCEPSIFCKD